MVELVLNDSRRLNHLNHSQSQLTLLPKPPMFRPLSHPLVSLEPLLDLKVLLKILQFSMLFQSLFCRRQGPCWVWLSSLPRLEVANQLGNHQTGVLNLDQSVSRQHAAVVPHKSGSIYVIDLGSAHGTFVANERLAKDTPVELEVGQSLRFAASTRSYILRKNDAALFPSLPPSTEIILPSSPDQNNEEAVVYYNTQINRYGVDKLAKVLDFRPSSHLVRKQTTQQIKRAARRIKKARVVFKDQVGGELFEVVGMSDGVDVGTEPELVGVKEGSLIGRYESLVQSVVIPKGKEASPLKERSGLQQGVTNRLQEVLTKVKAPPTQAKGLYDSLYDESLSGKLGSSWATPAMKSGGRPSPTKAAVQGKGGSGSSIDDENKLSLEDYDDDDDLFGD